MIRSFSLHLEPRAMARRGHRRRRSAEIVCPVQAPSSSSSRSRAIRSISTQVLTGQLTPVFFGSAMNNFGVQRFLERFIEMAPATGGAHGAAAGWRGDWSSPPSERFSGFIFKIQANMDPAHRDRVAFMRVCSGHFARGMEAKHARLEQEREALQAAPLLRAGARDHRRGLARRHRGPARHERRAPHRRHALRRREAASSTKACRASRRNISPAS